MDDARNDPENDRYAYSRTALARLVLSYELAELADEAAAHVRTKNDSWAHPGERVEEALALVQRAQDVLVRAVLYERQKGTSWESIGERLEITKQSAHARYKDAEEEWKLSLVEPYYPAEPGRPRSMRLHEAAHRPTDIGQMLDQWVRDHLTPHRDEDHPVTGHLPALSAPEEMVQVLGAIAHLQKIEATPAERAAVYERKASLLERIAVEDGRPEAAEQAADARARAAQLRADAEGDPQS